MRRQFFQAVRGILLALVLFELLFLLGRRIDWLSEWLSAYTVVIAAALLLLCLYWTWVRKARGRRTEYLVTMAPGAYGYIGGIFEKQKLGNLTREPGGWLAGVRTYRAEDGSLLFTVRRPGEGKPLVRAIGAIVLTAVLLGPLSVLSYVDMANTTALNWLGNDTPVSDTNTTDPIQSDPIQPDEPTQDDIVPDDTVPDDAEQTDTSLLDTVSSWFTGAQDDTVPDDAEQTDTGLLDTVSGWFTGAKDWVTGFFSGDDANYILPSHKRLLDEKDVEGMDVAQLQRAINEIYARHGCQLSSSADKEYFEAQDWYTPNSDMTLQKAQAEFSNIENQNVQFLAQCRDALRG